MGINFPATPTVGQKYPQPAVAGIPVYTWDGEKWTTVGGSVAAYAPPADAIPLMDQPVGAVGVGTDYAREDHVHPISTSTDLVKTVPQTLTAPQQQQARQNIYAAPFDAMAYSGLQINGGMEVSQESGTAIVTAPPGNAKYIVDGWYLVSTGGPNFAGSQIPTSGSTIGGVYFSYILQMACANPLSTAVAGNFAYVGQNIEGYRLARLGWGTAAAVPLTISFWIHSIMAGTISVAVRNTAGNRAYVVNVPVNAATTWEYKTITIPGDTTGTWAKDNTNGMWLSFCSACGATYQTAFPNTWVATNSFGTPTTSNFFTTANNYIYITGVTVLPGNEAPSAARSPFVMRPYDQELMTCQRYFRWLPFNLGFSAASAGYFNIQTVYFPTMRAAPAIGTLVADPASAQTSLNASTNVFQNPTPQSAQIQANATAAGACVVAGYRGAADARL